MYKRVFGAGPTLYTNVFKIYFDKPVSPPFALKAWDDDSCTTTDGEVFQGTPSNGSQSLIIAVDTADIQASWYTVDTVSGGNNPNRLKGDESYLDLDANSNTLLFNIALEVPKDLSGVVTTGYTLQVEYTYSGDPPNVLWFYNTNTEKEPRWKYIGKDKTIYWADGQSTETSLQNVVITSFITSYAKEAWVEI